MTISPLTAPTPAPTTRPVRSPIARGHIDVDDHAHGQHGRQGSRRSYRDVDAAGEDHEGHADGEHTEDRALVEQVYQVDCGQEYRAEECQQYTEEQDDDEQALCTDEVADA
ncbi:hypothetical protein [Arthrobacter globiformis]|uniref:hypothetical protein n=1 Tax=Arthrobacter globiformis TaxID=1665 RepID=UPI0027D82281|nr:hypothetical protein [Arthrobacter globiformis]